MAMNQQNNSSLYNNYQQAFWRFDEQLRMEHAGLSNNSNSNMNTNNHVNSVVSSKWNFTPSNAVPLSAFANMNLLDNSNANPKLVNNNSKTEARRNSYADHKPNNTAGRGKSKQKADKNHNVDWKHSVNESNEKVNVNSKCNDKNSNNNNNNNGSLDKRFKTLPATESLPRTEILGGYIFVCNNDTMQDDLKRQLFGLPQRYRDSVRAITPGLPLFLYNYTTHQLHGIFEASSFGGTNIDPTAWEDKKCRGESRFPAQVRIRTRRICKALEEDAFRPILHHYDGPKFRLQLSVPETLALLDIFNDSGL